VFMGPSFACGATNRQPQGLDLRHGRGAALVARSNVAVADRVRCFVRLDRRQHLGGGDAGHADDRVHFGSGQVAMLRDFPLSGPE
jgi:hypothetical protein